MDDTRLDALVHYLCARCEHPNRLVATRLDKVLWFSDVFAYAQYGQSITGAAYVRRQSGPAPKGITAARARLAAHGAIVERKARIQGHPEVQLIALKPADISMFTDAQISLVDGVLAAVCSTHTASGISGLPHNFVWESAEIGEDIPMAASAFGANFGDIYDDDIAWARNEVDRIERIGVIALG